MEAKFWHDMWDSGVVGFHLPDVNGYLKKHWTKLELDGQGSVLVPLCGKTLDLIWLAQQGHEVLGVELSQKALNEFLQENSLQAEPHQTDKHCGYKLPGMTLLCGDFFHVDKEQCQDMTAVYDRAALVALPPEMRQAYVKHLFEIVPSGSKVLLVTMEYDQSQLQGPPFSVAETEVLELFKHCKKLEKLEQVVFERKGVPALEKVFLIEF